MISGLVLNHLKGLGFVMNERYRPAAAGSRQVILTEPDAVVTAISQGMFHRKHPPKAVDALY